MLPPRFYTVCIMCLRQQCSLSTSGELLSCAHRFQSRPNIFVHAWRRVCEAACGTGCCCLPQAFFVALRCMSRRIIASSCVLHARSRYAFSFQCCTADSDNRFLTATRAFALLPFALTIKFASILKRCVGRLSLRPLNVQKCAIGLRVSGPRGCLLSLQA